jgi:hypothetical protein
VDNNCLRQHGQEIIRLREDLKQEQGKIPHGIARPTMPGSEARTVPQSPAERDAESIRIRLLAAELRYQDLGGTEEYLQLLTEELTEEESLDAEP